MTSKRIKLGSTVASGLMKMLPWPGWCPIHLGHFSFGARREATGAGMSDELYLTELQKIVACIERAETGIERGDQSIDDWLAQILQALILDSSSLNKVEAELRKAREDTARVDWLLANGVYMRQVLQVFDESGTWIGEIEHPDFIPSRP